MFKSLPSFSTKNLSQAGVNSCSSEHEDAWRVPEWFPQAQLDKQREQEWIYAGARRIRRTVSKNQTHELSSLQDPDVQNT